MDLIKILKQVWAREISVDEAHEIIGGRIFGAADALDNSGRELEAAALRKYIGE